MNNITPHINSPEIAPPKLGESSRSAWRWIIPLLIPTLALLIFWDLYYPLTAKSASDHVLSLVHEDMLVEDAVKVLRANGYDAAFTSDVNSSAISIERGKRPSIIGIVADWIPHKGMSRFSLWTTKGYSMSFSTQKRHLNRLDPDTVWRFDEDVYDIIF